MPDSGPLPELREDLSLYDGPRSPKGAPTWTLHDPSGHRFFQIGWLEFEVLSRWNLGEVEAISRAVNGHTSLTISSEDVHVIAQFLKRFNLLRLPGDELHVTWIQGQASRQRTLGRLLQPLTFMRFPLLRPEPLLGWLSSRMGWLYHRGFLAVMGLVLALDLLLIGGQWDAFLAAFPDAGRPFSLWPFAIAIVLAKIVHELGHALTAWRYGCRVPSLGVAMMFLWPTLYTDVSEAWKLSSKHQRLWIGAAGVTAEMILAAFAMLAWSFLPDGPWRQGAFALSATIWITTLVINLNPLMKFDGYYLLGDALGIANLQARARQAMQWWLRYHLMGFADPFPEPASPGRRKLLIGYAFGMWFYRMMIYAGLAVIIGQFFYKGVGLALMVVGSMELILRPMIAEMRIWMVRRGDFHLSGSALRGWGVVVVILMVLFLPWRSSIQLPALLQPAHQITLFAPMEARLEALKVTMGDEVEQGALMVRLSSPGLDREIDRLQHAIQLLRWQSALPGEDLILQAEKRLRNRERATLLSALTARLEQRQKLDIIAPQSGVVTARIEGQSNGDWIPQSEPLLTLSSPARQEILAYVSEQQIDLLESGAEALFYPEGSPAPPWRCRLQATPPGGMKQLDRPIMASAHGGTLPAWEKQGGWQLDGVFFRLRLIPIEERSHLRTLRGSVRIVSRPTSVAGSLLRQVRGVLIRELGV
ncbi:MAG: efflux RND transporter periplasmic adaptor subunit [Magnetococcales bacterium]|nr:efflux RND transporter periplasmic adaptor subunit [Magnetococcales bacterium]